jgi:hypothetical protein
VLDAAAQRPGNPAVGATRPEHRDLDSVDQMVEVIELLLRRRR